VALVKSQRPFVVLCRLVLRLVSLRCLFNEEAFCATDFGVTSPFRRHRHRQSLVFSVIRHGGVRVDRIAGRAEVGELLDFIGLTSLPSGLAFHR
jgi:hypothetical protein